MLGSPLVLSESRYFSTAVCSTSNCDALCLTAAGADAPASPDGGVAAGWAQPASADRTTTSATSTMSMRPELFENLLFMAFSFLGSSGENLGVPTTLRTLPRTLWYGIRVGGTSS